MTFYNDIKKLISSATGSEPTTLLARVLYITPEQRLQRLNEVFDTDKFSKPTSSDILKTVYSQNNNGFNINNND
ncbi:hypothetical protein UA38_05625 [Photobacterium kishitanii]|uniref:Uncharacterized protein n=1 Tax=Photobacterium kishitanii TaxID=318456 RepID=A0A2T3KND8_9GAMM|nr:hypothetical protein [Photobacterium kishitanii]KJG11176.1 hypothetical protein UB40_00615 [Photobacterium kishitanii]KJG58728.1 hypothetical protein UA38_05625 [Photobacterium kishitanii]KJG62762.1 hypothetical protein UA42_04545 [Photobacterium kishitanii]KJG66642.1 hypothetical protein UA40_06295 [Photobacterium kishitanii]KJG71003.1 hypothetical protein UA41_04180 [Photobacterium kishitanii]